MTPGQFEDKWLNHEFTAANYDKIDDSYLRRFASDVKETFGNEPASVLAYQPGTPYEVENLVRWGNPEAFYYALKKGLLSPPGLANPNEWKVVPGPVAATALWQAITRGQALGLEGTGVQAGRKYKVDFGPDAKGVTQYVYLEGLDKVFDLTRGTLEVGGVRKAIELIDLKAGTWQLAGTSTGPIIQSTSGGFALADYDSATLSLTIVLPDGASTDLSRYGIWLPTPGVGGQVFSSAFASVFI